MATALTTRPAPCLRVLPRPAPRQPPRPPRPGTDWLAPALVGAGALVAAALLYRSFLGVHPGLWYSGTHDRNSHYLYCLKLAADVRRGDVVRLLVHLNQAHVWPPLHAAVATGVLAVGGLDYRLAVLPGLLGWAGAVLLAFLVGRRAAPAGGNLAGLVAALFLLASPAYRAYATDVMLESLGACLSLAALYCYLAAVQDGPAAPGRGRRLGLALTALFLLKYNYWLLVVLALLADQIAGRPRAAGLLLRQALAAMTRGHATARNWARSQVRRPLNWVLAVLLLVIAVVQVRGSRLLDLGGRAVVVYPPHNLVHVAYVVLFLRLLSWWRSAGRGWVGGLDGRVAQVVRWHVVPVALWFLLPKRLSYFLWYLSPANSAPGQGVDLLAGIGRYARWALAEYHPGPWAGVLAAALCLAGLFSGKRLRPGAGAVLWLLLVGAVLTAAHPNQKARFLHSWLVAGWVAAGVGLAGLLRLRPLLARPRLRGGLAAAALAGVGLAAGPALLRNGYASEGGPHPERPCLLGVIDSYLPELDSARRATVLTAVPLKPLVQWTYLQRHGRLDRLEENWHGFGARGEANRIGFRRWLETTRCDTLVFLDRTPGSPLWEDRTECRLHAELGDLVEGQRVFRLVKRQELPDLGCRVSVWRRR